MGRSVAERPGKRRRRVKIGRRLPMHRLMRVSRLAPFIALALASAAGLVAVLSSREHDWRAPAVLGLLLVFAAVADRFEITTRSGASLVGSLPIFVLTAVLFGPAPAVAVAVAASLTQPRKEWQLI